MSLLPILLHPDPRLKKQCIPVPSVDADTRRLAESMIAEIKLDLKEKPTDPDLLEYLSLYEEEIGFQIDLINELL